MIDQTEGSDAVDSELDTEFDTELDTELDTEPDIETVPWGGAPSLKAAVEALVLVAVEPVTTIELAQATSEPVDAVTAALSELAAEYLADQRGFAIREVAGGWRFYTSPQCADLLRSWVLDGQQARLTQAALETLAVIAYKQPVTRARISAIRGVNVDGVVRTLVSRGLITEVGTDPASQAILYSTTEYFLERMGISALTELPDVSAYLPDLAQLDEFLDEANISND